MNFPINPTLLVQGTNCLAVEVHQQRPDSSDLSFDLMCVRHLVCRRGGERKDTPWRR